MVMKIITRLALLATSDIVGLVVLVSGSWVILTSVFLFQNR